MSGRAPEKAYLESKDTGERLRCRFNPREYTVSKSATWNRTPTRGARSAPRSEFVGANPRTMTMELFFDGWESTSGDVSRDVDVLLGWTNPTERSISNNLPNPPVVVFHWGTKSSFDAYVKQVSGKYTMFRGDGTPVRATVSITLEEVQAEPARQNPTSGGAAGRRTHVVDAGDSLHSVAYGEYGDPKLWRGLAAINGIDDPMRVPPGTTLLVPAGPAAAERS